MDIINYALIKKEIGKAASGVENVYLDPSTGKIIFVIGGTEYPIALPVQPERIAVSDTEPTDPDIVLWVDTSVEGYFPTVGGSGSGGTSGGGSGDGTIRLNEHDTPDFISNKIDTNTLAIEGGELKAISLKDLEANIDELNYLKGLRVNVQQKLDKFGDIQLLNNGAGNKFLSDDGTYLSIDSGAHISPLAGNAIIEKEGIYLSKEMLQVPEISIGSARPLSTEIFWIQLGATADDPDILNYKAGDGKWYALKLNNDNKVKMTETSDSHFLEDLIDKDTIKVDAGKLYVNKIAGQDVTISEVNFLKGAKDNIQNQIDALASVTSIYGVFDTKADLDAETTTPNPGQMALIRKDENYEDKQTSYVYFNGNWEILAELNIDIRNFATDPLDLETEVTGRLDRSNIEKDLVDIIELIETAGTGNRYLADDGTYKLITNTEGGNAREIARDESEVTNDTVLIIGDNDVEDMPKATIGQYGIARISEDHHNALVSNNGVLNVPINKDDDNAIQMTLGGLKVSRGDKVYGYFNHTDGQFYKERTFITKVIPTVGSTYIDTTVNAVWKPYVWDEDAHIYRGIGSGQGVGSTTTVVMSQDQYDATYSSDKHDSNFVYFVEDSYDSSEAIVAEMLADEVNKVSCVDIVALNNTIIEGFEVPELTNDQINLAFDSFHEKKTVYILDKEGTVRTTVNDISSGGGEVGITVIFKNQLILKYETDLSPKITAIRIDLKGHFIGKNDEVKNLELADSLEDRYTYDWISDSYEVDSYTIPASALIDNSRRYGSAEIITTSNHTDGSAHIEEIFTQFPSGERWKRSASMLPDFYGAFNTRFDEINFSDWKGIAQTREELLTVIEIPGNETSGILTVPQLDKIKDNPQFVVIVKETMTLWCSYVQADKVTFSNFNANDNITIKSGTVTVNLADATWKYLNPDLEVSANSIAIGVFDAIYPIGSYAFGVMPTMGVWEEVKGDRALWLKNTVDDGTEIEQALPNVTGALAAYSYNTSSPTGAFSVQSINPKQAPAGGDADRNFVRWNFNASSNNPIYKNNANVQPNAYVMKVFKRIA